MIPIFANSGKQLIRLNIYRKILYRQQCTPKATRDFSTQSTFGPITEAYRAKVEAGKIRYDEEQFELSNRLDKLYHELKKTDAKVMPANNLSVDLFTTDYQLVNYRKSKLALVPGKLKAWFYNTIMQPSPPRGVYIYGHVGVGKSFLMDLFHKIIHENNATARRRLRRIHFHEFMIQVHHRIHAQRRIDPKKDVLPSVALSLAQESRVLCFDEFQVTDIADAMILKRLFQMLWDAGVIVVATSNRSPDTLYEGGLNRALFIPFIDTLKENLDCILMSGETDYRRENNGDEPSANSQQSYFCPSSDEVTRRALKGIFASGGGETRTQTIPVMMGRTITAQHSNDTCAWFDFMDLCNRPLGAADYFAICEHFPLLIIDNVPQLNASVFNEARRFVTLVDAAYESRTRLVISSEVPLEVLLVDFQATFETHDGDEEIAGAEIQEEKHTQKQRGATFVKGEGGSSSSAATTFIENEDGTEVEWSATGRIGVSLAQLSAVQDVSFSFRRAESRLAEMNRATWGRSE